MKIIDEAWWTEEDAQTVLERNDSVCGLDGEDSNLCGGSWSN